MTMVHRRRRSNRVGSSASVVALMLGLARVAAADVWAPSTGPYGGQIQAVAVDPSNPATVYAVAIGGVYKSTDGAASWTLR